MTDPASLRVIFATAPAMCGGGFAVLVMEGGLDIAEISGISTTDTALSVEFEAAARGLSRLPSGCRVEIIHFSSALELTLARLAAGTERPDDWSADLKDAFDWFSDEIGARDVRISMADPALLPQGERLLRLAASAADA